MLLTLLAAVLGFVVIAGLGFAFSAPSSTASSKTLKRAQIVTGRQAAREAVRRPQNTQEQRRKQIILTLKEHDREQRKARLSIASRLRQAGLSISVSMFWIASVLAGVVAFVACLALRQSPFIGLGLAFGAGVGLPRWILGFLTTRRVKRFTEAFPDALDIVVRGIKSGLPVNDSLRIIGKEAPEPLASQFNRLVEGLGMGMTMEQALEKMHTEIPTSEVRYLAIVLGIQAKTGGNLAEALGNLSSVIRARKLMREKVKALAAEAVASAAIIGSLPPLVAIMLLVTAPDYVGVLFSDPRGHILLMIGGFWMACGIFAMRKMINFKL